MQLPMLMHAAAALLWQRWCVCAPGVDPGAAALGACILLANKLLERRVAILDAIVTCISAHATRAGDAAQAEPGACRRAVTAAERSLLTAIGFDIMFATIEDYLPFRPLAAAAAAAAETPPSAERAPAAAAVQLAVTLVNDTLDTPLALLYDGAAIARGLLLLAQEALPGAPATAVPVEAIADTDADARAVAHYMAQHLRLQRERA